MSKYTLDPFISPPGYYGQAQLLQALTTHDQVRQIKTSGTNVLVGSTVLCVISSQVEHWTYTTGTNADDNANFLRANDYDGAHVWVRTS